MFLGITSLSSVFQSKNLLPTAELQSRADKMCMCPQLYYMSQNISHVLIFLTPSHHNSHVHRSDSIVRYINSHPESWLPFCSDVFRKTLLCVDQTFVFFAVYRAYKQNFHNYFRNCCPFLFAQSEGSSWLDCFYNFCCSLFVTTPTPAFYQLSIRWFSFLHCLLHTRSFLV